MSVRRSPVARVARFLVVVLASTVVCVILVLTGFRASAAIRESRSREEIAPPTGRFVPAADVEVFIQEQGPADGPAVVLIHGTGAWGAIWRETMQALADSGFRAVAIDMPPFGFSERPEDANYDDAAQGQRIVGVLDQLQLSQATLVGHSFGGRPTMAAYFMAPERIRSLVLVDVALGLQQQPGPPAPAPWMVRAVLSAPPLRDALVATTATNPMVTRKLLTLLIRDASDATAEKVRMLQQPFPVRGSTAALGRWLAPFVTSSAPSTSTTRANYEKLTTPALVIWGADDTITPLSQGQDLAGLIPGAQLVVLPRTGHIPAVEDATAFNKALLAFLGPHAAPRAVGPR
ncbi:MAG: alpha/beta fold hydrolase [Gemmatimonadaceae bacterium]